MTGEKTEYIFLWHIENYSFGCYDYGKELISPDFTPDGLDGTSWNLWLYPRGFFGKGVISLYLNRCKQDAGPTQFPLKFELSFIAADGSPLVAVEKVNTFPNDFGYGSTEFLKIEEVILQRKAEYLPHDTLSVRCKMWKGEGDIQKIEKISARTRIAFEKISFLKRVENFSALKPNEKKTIQIQPLSETGCIISCSLYFIECSCSEGMIVVEIIPSENNYILCKQRISLLNASKNVIDCGEVDNRFDVEKQDIQKLFLSLTRKITLDKKGEYLPNDELSLLCECTFSTGIEYEKIVETQHELPVWLFKPNCRNTSNKGGYNARVKLSACTTAPEDLKAIYVNRGLTDVELKTDTKIFPAHKVVLCARSSVFKAMLTNDKREKNTNCIQVDDLENHIVKQLLLFLYSDNLEKLQWESAIKLYYAGDKYAIEKLKVLCSNFLVENVTTSTASELLLLAETHNDSDLKNFVEDFILKHKEQIIHSVEWKNLQNVNPQLVIKTMYLMVKGKKEVNEI